MTEYEAQKAQEAFHDKINFVIFGFLGFFGTFFLLFKNIYHAMIGKQEGEESPLFTALMILILILSSPFWVPIVLYNELK